VAKKFLKNSYKMLDIRKKNDKLYLLES